MNNIPEIMSRFNYTRRKSSTVHIGDITLGGDAPIRVQSMTNTSTLDTEASAAQAIRIAEAGGELVRLTTQGVREADNLTCIRKILDDKGCHVPLVADVHFNPKAAYAAAATCQKVRINPGNFVDAARTFKKLTYTDEEYAAEIQRIRDALLPFIDICRSHRTAVRLGVNHGSLSDRIMSRYGDSPAGMTESAMEYLRICRDHGFNDVIISMKSSNPVVMVEAVRRLVAAMDAEGMDYPLHLGVTEAGDGAEARIKSAMGIGALLGEGIGDTVRVSLSEPPENEIPVAKALVDYITGREQASPVPVPERAASFPARAAAPDVFGGVKALAGNHIEPQAGWHEALAEEEPRLFADDKPVILTSRSRNFPGSMRSWMDRFIALGGRNPIVMLASYTDTDADSVRLKAAADLGPLLMAGYGSAISIQAPMDMAEAELIILQGARLQFSKTEFIACPGCGRTMFDLQGTLRRVKEALGDMPGLKIGVMGCIVNGPGEMADADYGYVGAAAGKISLYRGKECVEMNIPQEEALKRLLELIEADRRDAAKASR